MKDRRLITWFAGLAATTVLGIVLCNWGAGGVRGNTSGVNPPVSLKLADPDMAPSRNSFAPIVKRALPEVVNISTSKVVKNATGSPSVREFFDFGDGRFNTPQSPQEDRERSLGSGVIVSPEGYIVTNNHVVEGATTIRITTSDKHMYEARIIGTDPKTDIAVLKVEAASLPAITIADSSRVQVGDYALAIGDPFGVGETVTMGIVSATERSNLGISDYEDFIQTDAPINPGNSGGALVNDRGELIGINTAILSHGSGGNQGVGFAIPSNMARKVVDQIVRNGKVTRAYMGIYIQEVSPELAKAFGEASPHGALVGDVTPESPAAKSDLKKGDIIVGLNGTPIADSNQLRTIVALMEPGTTANLRVWRDGSEHDTTVKLTVMPTEQERASVQPANPQGALDGVTVENVTGQAASELGFPANSRGVVVTDITPSSSVADSGLRKGDVIQEVNHQSVTNVNDFVRAIQKAGKNPLLLVNREGHTLFIAA